MLPGEPTPGAIMFRSGLHVTPPLVELDKSVPFNLYRLPTLSVRSVPPLGIRFRICQVFPSSRLSLR
jgi:hypothetical protein